VRIGIIGCGNIGQLIARGIKEIPKFCLAALADIDEQQALSLAESLPKPPAVVSNSQLIEEAELIVESACPELVPWLLEQACPRGKDLLIVSVGGMLNLPPATTSLLAESRSRIYLPSGALAGLDAVKAAAGDEIYSITLTTRKPPKGLIGAPYLSQAGIDLDNIQTPTTIFEGSAQEAVKAFPKNINVAAALSLAGIGPQRTNVRIIADPGAKTNSHEIEAVGKFGRLICRTENLPFPQNPKTSYLAALSALATLKKLASPIQVGT